MVVLTYWAQLTLKELEALEGMTEPLQDGHLLAHPQRGPGVGVDEHGHNLPPVNNENGLEISMAL